MGRIEVVNKEFDKTVRFADLKIGETFRWNNKIYLKLSMSCRMDMDNSFSFEENIAVHFSGNAAVIPINCKLVVEG